MEIGWKPEAGPDASDTGKGTGSQMSWRGRMEPETGCFGHREGNWQPNASGTGGMSRRPDVWYQAI